MGALKVTCSSCAGEPLSESSPVLLKSDQQSLVQQGQEAMREALRVLEQKEGWKVETVEVRLHVPPRSAESD